MRLQNDKKAGLGICLWFASMATSAHPGHHDVATVHGDGFGVWLAHQLLGADQLLTMAILVVLAVLTGVRLFRRRSRG